MRTRPTAALAVHSAMMSQPSQTSGARKHVGFVMRGAFVYKVAATQWARPGWSYRAFVFPE